MKAICARCGKEFERKPSKIARAKNPYCSFECRKKASEQTCPECGKVFVSANHGKSRDKQIYCSRACANRVKNRAKSVTVSICCDHCGKEFQIPEWRVSDYPRHFCSTKCKNAAHSKHIATDNNPRWMGGATTYRGADWPVAREAALQRDSYTCQHCGMTQDQSFSAYGNGLQVHHKTRYLDTFDNSLENLITLCVKCHGKEDTRYFSILYATQSPPSL